MDGHQYASALKETTVPRRLGQWTWHCWSVRTVRINVLVACAIILILCFVMFSMKDESKSFASVLPMDIISSKTAENFGSGILRKWPQWTVFSQLKKNKKITDAVFKVKDKSKKFPGAIIIGVRKGGTGALLEFLRTHPRVVANKEEMHFFSDDQNKYAKGMQWYQSRMPESEPNQLTMEKTPKYFISEEAPARIHRMNSSVRLVLILRNPVDRVISDFTQIAVKLKTVNRKQNFTKLVLTSTGDVNTNYCPVYVSTYHIHLARWLELFPLTQIHIVDGDRLISEPLQELRAVEKFLGLSPFFSEDMVYFNVSRGFYCMRRQVQHQDAYRPFCLDQTKGRQHPSVEIWLLDKLEQYFIKHNEILFRMIGRRFKWS